MKQGYFINGWSDLVANLQVNMNCIKLLDVSGNGQYNLVIADQSQRLLCYKNTHIEWETRMQDKPTSLVYLYQEQQTASPQPCIAIACGQSVYIYKIFKAFFQFKLPTLRMESQEEALWIKYKENGNIEQLRQSLSKLQNPSYKTLVLLCYEDQAQQIETANQFSDNLELEDSVTCLDVLKKRDDEYAPGILLLGTENKYLYHVSNDLLSTSLQIKLQGTPICIQSFPDQKVAVLMRENFITILQMDQDILRIDLSSKPITMVRLSNFLYVATQDGSVQKLNHNKREFQLQMDNNIIAMESVQYGRGKEVKGILIGLDNQTIQFYIETQLISTIKLDANVTAMKFGIFGREDGFLVIINSKGAIKTCILERAKQYVPQEQTESEIPSIELPKLTKLYLESTQREKDQGVSIIKQYQQDLLRMRLKTAQTYLAILNNDQVQLNQNQISLKFIVEGLGPMFKLICYVENIGNEVLQSISIGYQFNNNILQLMSLVTELKYLIPKHQRQFSMLIKNISGEGLSDIIRVTISSNNCVILTQAVQMPMSEIEQ